MSASRWERTRRAALRRAGYRSELSGRPGRLECHHIVPLDRGGEPYSLDNIRVLTRAEHIALHDNVAPDRAAWLARRRQTPGHRNEFGEFVPGLVVEEPFRASVQPLAIEHTDFVGGAMLSERVKVYVPEPDALVAAFEDRKADYVALADGRVFVVEESQSWLGHTRAILLRES